MTVRKTVGSLGSLTLGAASTAVNLARHPIGSASMAVGLTKGVAVAGIDLLRGGVEQPSAEDTAAPSTPTLVEEPQRDRVADSEPEVVESVEDPRDALPGPDLAKFEPPTPDELPEPIVIVADDAAYLNGESGESFHNEPKATSRDAEHGAGPEDLAETDDYVEDVAPADEAAPQP
jgi:hypothetical protein